MEVGEHGPEGLVNLPAEFTARALTLRLSTAQVTRVQCIGKVQSTRQLRVYQRSKLDSVMTAPGKVGGPC